MVSIRYLTNPASKCPNHCSKRQQPIFFSLWSKTSDKRWIHPKKYPTALRLQSKARETQPFTFHWKMQSQRLCSLAKRRILQRFGDWGKFHLWAGGSISWEADLFLAKQTVTQSLKSQSSVADKIRRVRQGVFLRVISTELQRTDCLTLNGCMDMLETRSCCFCRLRPQARLRPGARGELHGMPSDQRARRNPSCSNLWRCVCAPSCLDSLSIFTRVLSSCFFHSKYFKTKTKAFPT